MSAAGTAAWLALRLRRAQGRLAQVERKSEGLSAFVTDRRKTPVRSMTPIASPRFPHPQAVPALTRDPLHAALIMSYLAELCDRLGASETVIWRTQPDGTVAAAAWSGGVGAGSAGVDLEGARPDAVPPCFSFEKWMPLVQWAGEQQLLQCERQPANGGEATGTAGTAGAAGAKSVITFAVSPIADEARGYCALSASAGSGGALRGTESQIRSVLGRSASYVAELADLIHTQAQSDRQVRRANVLVNSAKMLQSKRSADNLAEAVCRDAMQITGGARAALVKWDDGAQSGFVLSVSPKHWVEAGQQVLGQSRVGESCAEDQPQVWEDARQLDRSTPVFGAGDTAPAVGSLLIVPMKQEQRVVGAIVVEGNAPGDVLASDVDALRTVAAIASASLDRLWHMEQVQRASITDPLTGLSNRRHFDEQLVKLLSEADQRGHPVSLIVLDVDHFKRVNDTHGHAAGDAVLQGIARIVEHTVRTGSHNDLCARYGGEELAVLLPGVPAMEAMEVAERLRRSIMAKGVLYHGKRIDITASFGVASYPETVRTHGALFPSADRALYLAKSAGRNLVKSAGVSEGAAATSDRAPLAKVTRR